MHLRTFLRRLTIFSIILLTAALWAACSSPNNTGLPTPYPTEYIPTVIALTVQAGISSNTPDAPTASATALPVDSTSTTTASAPPPSPSPQAKTTTPAPGTANVSPTNTRRPTSTPTPSPTPGLPSAAIQIFSIGPMSKIVSPLSLRASVETIPSGYVVIEIWAEPLRKGEEPRLLLRKIPFNFSSNPAAWVYLDEELDFEIPRSSEYGQLRLSVFDQYKRPVSVASVDLILLQYGETLLNPTSDLLENLVIREPAANKLIQGGTLIVSGLARPLGEPFILIELVTSTGEVVGYRQLFVTPAPDGGHVPFTIDVPYTVSEATWVRLTIREDGSRISGPRQLTSVELLLSP